MPWEPASSQRGSWSSAEASWAGGLWAGGWGGDDTANLVRATCRTPSTISRATRTSSTEEAPAESVLAVTVPESPPLLSTAQSVTTLPSVRVQSLATPTLKPLPTIVTVEDARTEVCPGVMVALGTWMSPSRIVVGPTKTATLAGRATTASTAWSVWERPSGTVMVPVRPSRDTAQSVDRADGVATGSR